MFAEVEEKIKKALTSNDGSGEVSLDEDDFDLDLDDDV